MPDRTSFDESMLLARARLRVQDDDLKHGTVEMLMSHTVVGPVQAPWGVQGGFAVVYKFCTQSGKMRALRCFLVQVKPDTQFRYERIGAYFAAQIPDITAGFKYHNDGIAIKENVQGQLREKTYPLVEMEWIEGVTLLDHVDEQCRKRDRTGLADVVSQWLAILNTLRQAKIAHGDLAGANVMVRPNGRLVLVDYDGVYIPDFAGRQPVVAGQADYQHPQMQQRPFNEEADNFSALVIYTALLALQAQPELWDRYILRKQQGRVLDAGLLFKQQDFLDPDRSPLISELEKMSDLQVSMATQALKQACREAIAQVQFPFHIIDPDFNKKQALAKLEGAIQRDVDEEIVAAWISSLLDNYAPAQQYVARVGRARQTLQTLKHFRDALQTRSMQQIITAYDPTLDHCNSVAQQERDLLRLARNFIAAYNQDDDEALASVCAEIRTLNYGGFFAFTPQEAQRSALAQQRTAALVSFRQALASKDVQQTVRAYDTVLDSSQHITAEERSLLQLARDFVQACNTDDDQAIIAASDALQHVARFTFTLQEQQRIMLARQRTTALTNFRLALASRSIQQIVTAYNTVLDSSKDITYEERSLLQVARDFVQACQSDDDLAIAAAGETIQQAQYSQSLAFNVQEEQRITLAQQRKAALDKFRAALASRRVEQLVAAYDPVLTGCKNVTQNEREQYSLAHDLLQAYQADDDQAIIAVWNDIQRSPYQQSFSLTVEEQQRIELAKQRMTALEQFRKTVAAKGKEAEQIVFAYDSVLDGCKEVTAKERALLQAARRSLDMQESVLAAIRADSDEQIASAYDEELVQQFSAFTAEQQERINRGLKRGRMKNALQSKDYGRAIRLSQEIERESRKPIADFQLTVGKQKFIKQFDAKDVEAWLQGGEVVVRWRWPADDLVRYALVVWRVDRWPQRPRREEPGTERVWGVRSGNEQSGTARFRVVQMPVYLQVYLAMPDETRHPPTWFYSTGDEPGSKTIAYYQGSSIEAV